MSQLRHFLYQAATLPVFHGGTTDLAEPAIGKRGPCAAAENGTAPSARIHRGAALVVALVMAAAGGGAAVRLRFRVARNNSRLSRRIPNISAQSSRRALRAVDSVLMAGATTQ